MQRLRIVLIPLLLLSALHGSVWVPYWSYIGLDFLNLFMFHHNCPGWGEIYLLGGAVCGDPINRPMVYPPVLYWMMSWVRFFDFKTALSILMGVNFIAIAGGMRFFYKKNHHKTQSTRWQWFFGCLLFGSLPFVYEFERGNHNGWVLGLWVIASLFILRQQYFWAGFFSVFAVAFKLYPIVPFVLVTTLLLHKKRWSDLKFWVLGAITFSIPILAIFWKDHWDFFRHSLPNFALSGGGVSYTSHTLYRGWGGLAIKLPGLILWARWMMQSWEQKPAFVLSAMLAIATFFPNTSNDYNLVTAFPFLLILIYENWPKSQSKKNLAMACLTLFALIGDRTVWDLLGSSRGNTYTHVLWFILFPLLYRASSFDERCSEDFQK